MGVKLGISPSAHGKLTIPDGIDLKLGVSRYIPTILEDFEKTEEFKEFVPEIQFNSDPNSPDWLKLTVTNVTNNDPEKSLTDWLNQSIEVFPDVPESTTTYSKSFFQIGIIIVRHHRSRKNPKGGKRLTPWIHDTTTGYVGPLGAAVAWNGSPWEEDGQHHYVNFKRKLKVDPEIGPVWEIEGFDELITHLHPRERYADGRHNCYYFGVMFRIRNPYTNEFITTKPSRLCIARTKDSAGLNLYYYYR